MHSRQREQCENGVRANARWALRARTELMWTPVRLVRSALRSIARAISVAPNAFPAIASAFRATQTTCLSSGTAFRPMGSAPGLIRNAFPSIANASGAIGNAFPLIANASGAIRNALPLTRGGSPGASIGQFPAENRTFDREIVNFAQRVVGSLGVQPPSTNAGLL